MAIPEPESEKVNTVKYVTSFIDLCKNNYLLGSQRVIALSTNNQFPGLKSSKTIQDLSKVLKLDILAIDKLVAAENDDVINDLKPHTLITNPMSPEASPAFLKLNDKISTRWEAFY